MQSYRNSFSNVLSNVKHTLVADEILVVPSDKAGRKRLLLTNLTSDTVFIGMAQSNNALEDGMVLSPTDYNMKVAADEHVEIAAMPGVTLHLYSVPGGDVRILEVY